MRCRTWNDGQHHYNTPHQPSKISTDMTLWQTSVIDVMENVLMDVDNEEDLIQLVKKQPDFINNIVSHEWNNN